MKTEKIDCQFLKPGDLIYWKDSSSAEIWIVLKEPDKDNTLEQNFLCKRLWSADPERLILSFRFNKDFLEEVNFTKIV